MLAFGWRFATGLVITVSVSGLWSLCTPVAIVTINLLPLSRPKSKLDVA